MKGALEKAQGWLSVPIQIPQTSIFKHLFVKANLTTPKAQKKFSDFVSLEGVVLDRSIFVTNLTFDCTNEDLESIFSKFGSIEQIKMDSFYDVEKNRETLGIIANTMSITKRRELEQSYQPSKLPFTSSGYAFITFTDTDAIENVKQAKKNDFVGKCERGSERGLKKWLGAYKKQTQINMANLQKEVDQWMFDYEKTKEEERMRTEQMETDDDGWTTVTTKKKSRREAKPGRIGAANMSQEQLAAAFKAKESNRHKQDFYRFQTRENKVNKLVQLRKKFEEDKQRIAKMKEGRKFKPY
jgi:ribosomal RNA-processing protein 7